MIIYKITNLINGKIYIGQTIRTLVERWKDHQRKDSNSVISKAIRKYGVKNFKIEDIDNADNTEELNKKEIEWIAKCVSVVPNGYNLSGGGGNGTTHLTTKEKISEKMKGKIVSKKHRLAISKTHSISIYQYDLNGKFIKEWPSATVASKELNVGNSELNKCCVGKRRQSAGFQWSYQKHESIGVVKPKLKPNTKGRSSPNRVPVAKIDADGNIMETYKSAVEAALKNNCDHSSVCKVCNHKLKNTKGLLFIFLENSR